MAAINRTGWQPNATMWPKMEEMAPGHFDGLEIVRILIRPFASLDGWEKDALRVLDNDHQMYGIPLFVADINCLSKNDSVDFAIGFNRHGKAVKCYEFDNVMGIVDPKTAARGERLAEVFKSLLEDPKLKTVSEYLGNVMIKDPEDSASFAEKYNTYRSPSDQIVKFISDRVGDGEAGADIGCGTGNYTFPFAGQFKKLFGVEINEDLIGFAQERKKAAYGVESRSCEFVRADAVCMPSFKDGSVDAVWSVSTLHYLRGKRQWHFLRECHRILKKGGKLVIDVGEFLDQHPSLWVKEYFPSLKKRYKDSLFMADDYRRWLKELGYQKFECVPVTYEAGEKDMFIRAGQRNPDLYLSDQMIKANPAFWEMSPAEIQQGQNDIREDRDSGKLKSVIDRCVREATMEGDFGFLVATR